MTTQTKRRRPAVKKPARKPAAKKPVAPVNKLESGIPNHGVTFGQAMRQGWYYFAPAVFGIFIGGLIGVAAPAAGAGILLVFVALSFFLFYTSFKSQLMPILTLEMNEEKDKLQLRVYYAMKGEYGAEGRFDVFGDPGYCLDNMAENKTKPLTAFQVEADYNSTTPESLRYMCEHSASSEAYRRQSSTLKRDIVNWTAVIILIGIFGFLTFTIGSSILGDGT